MWYWGRLGRGKPSSCLESPTSFRGGFWRFCSDNFFLLLLPRFAEYCVVHVLLKRNPAMFSQHFIECIFHFNSYEKHQKYNRFPQSLRSVEHIPVSFLLNYGLSDHAALSDSTAFVSLDNYPCSRVKRGKQCWVVSCPPCDTAVCNLQDSVLS